MPVHGENAEDEQKLEMLSILCGEDVASCEEVASGLGEITETLQASMALDEADQHLVEQEQKQEQQQLVEQEEQQEQQQSGGAGAAASDVVPSLDVLCDELNLVERGHWTFVEKISGMTVGYIQTVSEVQSYILTSGSIEINETFILSGRDNNYVLENRWMDVCCERCTFKHNVNATSTTAADCGSL